MIDVDRLLIEKYNVRKRLVEMEDAKFITNLRADTELCQFIHFGDGSLKNQIEWLRKYKEREKQEKEYYFIFESLDGKTYGTERFYDFDDHSFVGGSWLFTRDSPAGLPVLCELAARKFAFEISRFVYNRLDVRKGNKKVLNYHRKVWKVQTIAEDELNFYFILNKNQFYKRFDVVLEMCL